VTTLWQRDKITALLQLVDKIATSPLRTHLVDNFSEIFTSVHFPSIYISGVNIRESTICADEENFYVIGGRDQPTAVKCFNVMTQTWSQLTDMPEGRRSAGQDF
jgi:hypothetical protein